MRPNLKSKLMLLVAAGVFFTGNLFPAIAMADLYTGEAPVEQLAVVKPPVNLDIDAPPPAKECCKKADVKVVAVPAKKVEPAAKSETDAIAVASPQACEWKNVGGKFACVFLPPSQAPGGYLWVSPKTPRTDKLVKDVKALEGRTTALEVDKANKSDLGMLDDRVSSVERENKGTAAALTGINGRLDGIDQKLAQIGQSPAPVPQPAIKTGAALAPPVVPQPAAPIIVPVQQNSAVGNQPLIAPLQQPIPVQQPVAPVVADGPSWASRWLNLSVGMNLSLALSGVEFGAGIGHRSDGVAIAVRTAVGVGYTPHDNKNYGHVFPSMKLALGATLGNYFEALLFIRESGDPTVGEWGKWGTSETGVALGASLSGLLEPKEWYSNIILSVELSRTKAGGPFHPGEGTNIGLDVSVPF